MCKARTVQAFRVALTTTALLLAVFPARADDVGAGKLIPLSAEAKKALAPLGKGTIGEPVPAVPITDSSQYYVLQGGDWQYMLTSGDHEGRTRKVTQEKVPADEQGTTHKRVIGDLYVQQLRKNDSGGIALVSEAIRQHNLVVKVDPGIVLIENLKPGESAKMDSKLGVYKLGDPSSKEYGGKVKVVVTYEGAYKVNTPAGTFDAILIKSQYKVHVGPAIDVTDESYALYAENVGKVADTGSLHISALLVYNKHIRQAKVLSAAPTLAAPPRPHSGGAGGAVDPAMASPTRRGARGGGD